MTITTRAPARPPLNEVKELVGLHARSQGLTPRHCHDVLSRIDRLDGEDRGAWPSVWSKFGDDLLARGRALDAARHHTLARFPFAGDVPRQRSARAAVTAFDTWRRRAGYGRLELAADGRPLSAWTAGLGRDRPTVLVVGGIVSTKEQWGPFLTAAERLQLGVVVTEMPGVGENEGTYGPGSTEMFSEIVDRLGPRAGAAGVHVLALSFAGQLALRAAPDDPRLRSVLTVGAPVHDVFRDPRTWEALPRTTTATLEHLCGTPGDEGGARARLAPLALTGDDLARIDVPVRYVASRRDEIVPRREWERLAEAVDDLEWIEFDDVHGSPAHLVDSRRWLVGQLLAATVSPRGPSARRRALTALLTAAGPRPRRVRGGRTALAPGGRRAGR